jgi:DNA-binding PadR family transcriptional regulator
LERLVASRDFRMTPAFFHLLLALSAEPKHGYAMMREIAERTGGRISLGPSSLYYSLGRLEDAGLIQATDGPAEGDDPHEERRRYYRLTDPGREKLRVESAVLADIVAHARTYGLLP